MSLSELVDVVSISLNDSYAYTIYYDYYNKTITVADFNKNVCDKLKNYTYLDYVTCGLDKINLYIRHFLIIHSKELSLGSGNCLSINLTKTRVMDMDISYGSFCQKLIQPYYRLYCSSCADYYDIYIPTEYIVKPLLYLMTGDMVYTFNNLEHAISGKSSGYEVNEDVRNRKGLFGVFKKRKLKEEVELYLNKVSIFNTFTKNYLIGEHKDLQYMIRSTIGNTMDYLVRDELECAMLNTHFGFSYKWNYIEKAIPTQFTDFILNDKLDFIGNCDIVYPRSYISKELRKCKVISVPFINNRMKFCMHSYIMNGDTIIAKFDFCIGQPVSLKTFNGCNEQITRDLKKLLILDANTKNILCSDESTKEYFIKSHAQSNRNIDYFKGVNW